MASFPISFLFQLPFGFAYADFDVAPLLPVSCVTENIVILCGKYSCLHLDIRRRYDCQPWWPLLLKVGNRTNVLGSFCLFVCIVLYCIVLNGRSLLPNALRSFQDLL